MGTVVAHYRVFMVITDPLARMDTRNAFLDIVYFARDSRIDYMVCVFGSKNIALTISSSVDNICAVSHCSSVGRAIPS